MQQVCIAHHIFAAVDDFWLHCLFVGTLAAFQHLLLCSVPCR